MPPFVAGRKEETEEFKKLLRQNTILDNMVLTGLRGTGKTVLLETFKPIAQKEGWLWAGTDVSESTCISQENLATRLLTDLALVTSSIVVQTEDRSAGFTPETKPKYKTLNYQYLYEIYENTPGLIEDKLKYVLEYVWQYMQRDNRRGIIFAYDEAQNLSDHAAKDEYPLSLLLGLFQSIQRKGIPFMLVLTGLPPLFPKLVEARTYAERMFHIVVLDQLDRAASRDAILVPIQAANCRVVLSTESVEIICDLSSGYPFFIQLICQYVYDVWFQQIGKGQAPAVPQEEILRKLDSDFFSGRWDPATDRQKALLSVIASLDSCASEFTIQEIVRQSEKMLPKPFASSQVSAMLTTLNAAGLVYKSRHGKHLLAVPLLWSFIRRQTQQNTA